MLFLASDNLESGSGSAVISSTQQRLVSDDWGVALNAFQRLDIQI